MFRRSWMATSTRSSTAGSGRVARPNAWPQSKMMKNKTNHDLKLLCSQIALSKRYSIFRGWTLFHPLLGERAGVRANLKLNSADNSILATKQGKIAVLLLLTALLLPALCTPASALVNRFDIETFNCAGPV